MTLAYKTLIPAYGRDYRNTEQVLGDWKTGKDFQCAVTGGYCSIRDFIGNAELPWIRYDRQRRTVKATHLI